MSLKIQIITINLKQLIKDYKEYIKNNNFPEKKTNPDFIKYEVKLFSQLGFDLDIETPFRCFYHYFYFKFVPNNKEENVKMDKVKNFCFNLINDSYTRPLSIYYHPKIIYLSCLILTLKFLEYKEYDINNLIKDEKIDVLTECMEKIYFIYFRFIEDKNNINNDKNKDNQNNNTESKNVNNNKIDKLIIEQNQNNEKNEKK